MPHPNTPHEASPVFNVEPGATLPTLEPNPTTRHRIVEGYAQAQSLNTNADTIVLHHLLSRDIIPLAFLEPGIFITAITNVRVEPLHNPPTTIVLESIEEQANRIAAQARILAGHDVQERVHLTLNLLAGTPLATFTPEGAQFSVTKKFIAQTASITLESIYAALNKLENRGVVSRDGRFVTLKHPAS